MLQLKIAPSLREIKKFKSSRNIEYAWVYMNIPQGKNRILDVGSVGSFLPIILGQMGYDVWCLDVRRYEYEGLLSNIQSILGDIRKTNFGDNFFDIVTVVSTIEHIGLGRYGDHFDLNGDKAAITEIKRILKNTRRR